MKIRVFTKKGFSKKAIFYGIIFLFYAILLLPFVYMAFVNRATGDDFANAVLTRSAWISTHSILQVIVAAIEWTKELWFSYQGTWFTVFLFSLQPEVFHEKAYFLTTLIMMLLFIGSYELMMCQILERIVELKKVVALPINLIFLSLLIQFIPKIRPLFFWYVGCVHYTVPFSMCQLLVFFIIKYYEKQSKAVLLGITLILLLLGGGNYQAALLGGIVVFSTLLFGLLYLKKKAFFLLLPSLFIELGGLIISMIAPGNKVRGGEELGFSFVKILETLYLSFVLGIKYVIVLFRDMPIIPLILVFIFIIITFYYVNNDFAVIKHPYFYFIMSFLTYIAMGTPEIYANVEVSGGVENTRFLVLMYFCLIAIVLLAQRICISYKQIIVLKSKLLFPIVGLLLVFGLFVGRSDIKKSSFWNCMEYIRSGQAADYKAQMDLQTKILLNGEIQDVVLPFINNIQGPLMCMPAIDDYDAWTNTNLKKFYKKNSVYAIPRAQWEEEYMIKYLEIINK